MVTFDGAVLVGGASTRMGRDKATLPLADGMLGSRSVRALQAAGASAVFTVGSAEPVLGVPSVPDAEPGIGPLGGLLSALAHGTSEIVVVLACDLPGVCAEAVAAVIEGLATHEVAIAAARGRTHPLIGAYRRDVLPALRTALAADERALHRALATLDVATVEVPEAWTRNANRPEDLAEEPPSTRATSPARVPADIAQRPEDVTD